MAAQKRKLTKDEARRLTALLEEVPPEPVGAHLTDDEFIGYASGMLSTAEIRRADVHLAGCMACVEELLFLVEDDPETLTFTMRNRVVALLGHLGLVVRRSREEQKRISSLLKNCRVIGRDRSTYADSHAAKAVKVISSGSEPRDEDALSPSAAYAIRAGDGFNAIVVVSPQEGNYELQVVLENSEGMPLTGAKISWGFRGDTFRTTIPVPTGAVRITEVMEGIVDLSIAVWSREPLRIVVKLQEPGSTG